MSRVDVIMSIEGGGQLLKALRKKPKEFFALLAQRLPDEGENLAAAAAMAAPSVSGELASSASVTSVAQESKGVVRVAAAFLDEKAAAVHEGVHWGQHIEGTEGLKFFEKTANAFEQGFIERIGQNLKKLTEGGT